MEKTLSVEERIRRAEEIYARRKNYGTGTSISDTRVPVGERKNSNPLRKMLIQICICVMIYSSFYIIKNGDYIFATQLTDKIKQILEYDMNIQNMGQDALNYINEMRNKNVVIPEENKVKEGENEQIEEEQQNENNGEIQDNTQTEENQTEENQQEEILGITDEPLYTEDASSISQTQIDADYIKQNYSIIKPLTGTITSRFGNRNPTTETVPKYHTGIDIARNIGTKIISAMEGDVTLVSSSGDYRKSYKNCEW